MSSFLNGQVHAAALVAVNAAGTGYRRSRPPADPAALVAPGLPGIPGPLQLRVRGKRAAAGCRRPGTPGPARPAAGGIRPAGLAAPRRCSGPGPAGPGRAHRCRRRRGPRSPPASAGWSPPAPAQGDRRPDAGWPLPGSHQRASGSASRSTAGASSPHRRAGPDGVPAVQFRVITGDRGSGVGQPAARNSPSAASSPSRPAAAAI